MVQQARRERREQQIGQDRGVGLWAQRADEQRHMGVHGGVRAAGVARARRCGLAGEQQLPLLDDADAYAFGTPTRYGNVASQLKQFIDSAGGLWAQGVFADKPATAFVSAANVHGCNESTLLALYNTLHHWGSLIVSPGYTDPAVYGANGNPYGTAHASANGGPGENILEAARYQGRRLADITTRLLTGTPAA